MQARGLILHPFNATLTRTSGGNECPSTRHFWYLTPVSEGRVLFGHAPLDDLSKLPKEAAPMSGMAGGTGRVDYGHERIRIAVDEQLLDLLRVSAGSALVPQFLTRP